MMQPWNETGQRPEITVYLDGTDETAKKDFHCLVCGKICFEYYSNVRIILPGQPDQRYWKAPVRIQCNRRTQSRDGNMSGSCKTVYYVA